MGFYHRKVLETLPKLCTGCLHDPPPRPPPPPFPPQHNGYTSGQKHLITTSMIIMACMIVGALMFGLLLVIIRVYHFKRNNSRRRNSPILFATQDDFVDEEHGPEVDHPIWYINTVGLQQSIIDSITVFKYKKDEPLIEGTECSVCLTEFQEDESLRLLPKCSHAFHISCIDTWLRSHKTCPLCRAPIVNDAVVAQAITLETNLNGLGLREETPVENDSELRSSNVEEGGTSEARIGDDNIGSLPIEDKNSAENSKSLIPTKVRNSDSDSRVLSDLADNRLVVGEDVQTMRRSVSLDSSSASMIYKAVANINPEKSQGSSYAKLLHLKNSRSKGVAKRSSGNLSISKLMKSSSIGRSLQKGPVSMKRSSSPMFRSA